MNLNEKRTIIIPPSDSTGTEFKDNSSIVSSPQIESYETKKSGSIELNSIGIIILGILGGIVIIAVCVMIIGYLIAKRKRNQELLNDSNRVFSNNRNSLRNIELNQ